MDVIDFRARPNTEEYMAMYPKDYDTFDRMPDQNHPGSASLDDFVDRLDQNGIERAVFTGRQYRLEGELVGGISNDYIAECVEQYPDRLFGFAGIDYTAPIADAVGELERAIENLGLTGVSLDPGIHADILPDNRVFYPLYSKASALDIPVILTLGPNVGTVGESHTAAPVDRVATDFPDLTIVCSHAAWPRPTEFVNLAYRRPNVYIEGSIYQFFPGAEPFIEAAGSLIPEKVLYASAHPFSPLDTIERFCEMPISNDALEKITYDNSASILGL